MVERASSNCFAALAENSEAEAEAVGAPPGLESWYKESVPDRNVMGASGGPNTMVVAQATTVGQDFNEQGTPYYGGVSKEVFIGAVDKGYMEMGFEVFDVRRALAAVSRITSKGNRVAFGPEEDDNYIQNVKSGKKQSKCGKGVAHMWWM